MTKQIHSGIAAGQVPEGYKLEHGYVIPKEWKVVHFNECFHRLTQKNTENNQNVLTISAQQGLISQLDYYNTLYASEDKTGYFLLQKGDFAYNKSYSADYAYGAIKQLEKYDKGIVSPLYICFSANEGTNTDFYRQYFEAGMFNREIYKIAQEGARNHGLLNVSTPEFFSAVLVFPPVEEQKKIAEVLSCCNRVIELKQQLIAEMQQLKSGFLQAMFPAKGHSEPDIRFPEFSGDWEQRKLLDCVEKITDFRGRTPKKLGMDWSESGYLALSALNVKDGYIDFTQDVHYGNQELYDKWMTGNELHKGQVLFTTEAPMGNVAQVPDNRRYILSQRTIAFSVKEDLITENFLATILRSPNVIATLTALSSGGTAKGVSQKSLSTVAIIIPNDLGEQERLANTFLELDHLITLHQRELEETKKKKKSLAKLLLTGSVRVPT